MCRGCAYTPALRVPTSPNSARPLLSPDLQVHARVPLHSQALVPTLLSIHTLSHSRLCTPHRALATFYTLNAIHTPALLTYFHTPPHTHIPVTYTLGDTHTLQTAYTVQSPIPPPPSPAGSHRKLPHSSRATPAPRHCPSSKEHGLH